MLLKGKSIDWNYWESKNTVKSKCQNSRKWGTTKNAKLWTHVTTPHAKRYIVAVARLGFLLHGGWNTKGQELYGSFKGYLRLYWWLLKCARKVLVRQHNSKLVYERKVDTLLAKDVVAGLTISTSNAQTRAWTELESTQAMLVGKA